MKSDSSKNAPTRPRLGIFGGTFNPVHNGHVIMAITALEQAHLERLHVIPVRTPPHKDASFLRANDERLVHLSLAFEGVPGIFIDPREIESKSELSYSVLTLEALHTEFPEHELCFILGADSVASLPSWYEADRVVALATFLWMDRPGVSPGFMAAAQKRFPSLRAEQLVMPQVDISSTDIRERIRTQRCLQGRMPTAVIARIEANRAIK